MASVSTVCEVCEGKRFDQSVLEYHLGGRDISEVLGMSVTEAEEFFKAGEAKLPAAHKILERLAAVGLRYLTIGQPLTTLSGGERQRLKLATHLRMPSHPACMSSTSRPPVCTSPTSSSCSASSTGSSTPASRSSSSSTTRRSWRT